MITKIGVVSGKILSLLEEKFEPMSISQLKSYIDEPLELIYMSVGALVREGFIHIDAKSDEYLITTIKADCKI